MCYVIYLNLLKERNLAFKVIARTIVGELEADVGLSASAIGQILAEIIGRFAGCAL